MLAKLAFRNIKRSFRDYGIYFITLVFGVAVFYAFNSIHSQSILFDLGNSGSMSVFETTGLVLRIFSIVIACVLGFLVIYANRFLIRRRKHEFGTYLTLGMRPSHVSRIVLYETLMVGLVSLAVGLLIGLALSQGLSFLTAFLFNVPMTQYQFVFSSESCLSTLGCFAVIFFIVALFNTFTVSRYKLIDLLSARSKNERLGNRRPAVSFVLFIMSIAILAVAYWLLIQNGLVDLYDPRLLASTVLMVIGTLLFFYSLAGFAIVIIQRTRGIYFKRLNTFTLRQIASKINTASFSLGFVSIMLFFSITVFSCGMGMVDAFTGAVDEGTKYDATLTAHLWKADQAAPENKEVTDIALAEAKAYNYDIAAYLANKGVAWDSFARDTVQLDIFQVPEVTYGQLTDITAVGLNELLQKSLAGVPLEIIGETQYNALSKVLGIEAINLGQNGYVVNNLAGTTDVLAGKLADLEAGVDIQGTTLKPMSNKVFELPLEVFSVSSDGVQFVVPDAVIGSLESATPYRSYLNINYLAERVEGDEALYAALAAAIPPSETLLARDFQYGSSSWPVSLVFTANENIVQAGGMRMMITYLALYIGFVFLITTAAVLAIQQLSEASDSIERYRMLSQIGCDSSMISHSVLAQVLIYFLTPLVLAICHSACAIGVLSDSLFSAVGITVLGASSMAAVLVTVIYGTYLLITYFASRGIIMQAIGHRRV